MAGRNCLSICVFLLDFPKNIVKYSRLEVVKCYISKMHKLRSKANEQQIWDWKPLSSSPSALSCSPHDFLIRITWSMPKVATTHAISTDFQVFLKPTGNVCFNKESQQRGKHRNR